jgi:5-formyltetrahydrofolate cyclo-ligase
MTKKELRKIFIDKRKALSDAEYLRINQILYDYFFAGIDLSFIQVLHIFLTIEKQREPNTWPILNRIQKEFPHIRLSIPRVSTESGTLDNFFYEGPHQLKNNIWGIPEPSHGVPTPSEKIDMVLVPLLAVDNAGHRVGYGKGFYDKLLATCSPDCKRVGISLFEPVESINDIGEHDLPLDMVITPSGIICF